VIVNLLQKSAFIFFLTTLSSTILYAPPDEGDIQTARPEEPDVAAAAAAASEYLRVRSNFQRASRTLDRAKGVLERLSLEKKSEGDEAAYVQKKQQAEEWVKDAYTELERIRVELRYVTTKLQQIHQKLNENQ